MSPAQLQVSSLVGGNRWAVPRCPGNHLCIVRVWGLRDRNGAWSATHERVRCKYVSGVSKGGNFTVRTDSGTKGCNLGWQNVSIASSSYGVPVLLSATQVWQTLAYYGQDPYGPDYEPDTGGQILPNPSALRFTGSVSQAQFSTKLVSP